MKKSTVNLADKIFPIQYVEDSPLREGINPGILFRIIDDGKDEIIGCIGAYVSSTTLAMWNNNWNGKKVTRDTLPSLFATILPYIPIAENIDKIQSLYLQGGSCYTVRVNSQDPDLQSDSSGTHIKGGLNPDELVKRIVYSGKLTDEAVEREILKLLYNYRLESHNTKLLVGEIQNSLFIPENYFNRCLDYLRQKEFVDLLVDTSQIVVSASISIPGVEYIRNNFRLSEVSQVIMGDQIIGGDKISASTTGADSPIVIKSHNVSLIHQSIKKLEYEIEHNYQKNDKQELLGQVKEIKALAGDRKNYSKIASMLGNLLTKTSEFASIASAIIQLLQLVTQTG